MSKLKRLLRRLKNKFLFPFISITGIALSSISYAIEGDDSLDFYAGSELNIRRMRFKKNFGNKIFKDPFYKELNVFIGRKINKYLGLEVGYELSNTKVQSKNIQNGSFLFGCKLIDTCPGFDSITNTIRSRSKIEGFNISLMGLLPIAHEEKLNLIGSIGLCHLKSNTTFTLTEVGETNIVLSDELNIPVQRIARTESKYKDNIVTIKASTGVQYLTTRNFGIRGLVTWENTHKIKIQGVDRKTLQKSNDRAKFKDSITYRIGFFIPF